MGHRIREHLPEDYRWWMDLLPERIGLLIIGLRLIHRATPEQRLEISKFIDKWKATRK